jgi:hypothetical protein
LNSDAKVQKHLFNNPVKLNTLITAKNNLEVIGYHERASRLIKYKDDLSEAIMKTVKEFQIQDGQKISLKEIQDIFTLNGYELSEI